MSTEYEWSKPHQPGEVEPKKAGKETWPDEPPHRQFQENADWCRSCGYELICSVCGQGINPGDESDEHEPDCPLNPRTRPLL